MKKTIAILLALCLCIGLCACNSNSEIPEDEITETPAAETEIWKISKTVDEFGDISEDSESVMQTLFTGSFQNTATTDGELSGTAYILYNEAADRSYIGFKLFEYGNSPVICTDYDTVTLKTKVGDVITEYDNVSYNYIEQGTLFIGISTNWLNYDGNKFIDALYNGNDIRCIFYINKSEYKFTVESGNFKAIYDQPGVGKVRLPGTLAGEWEYVSGDATLFSKVSSGGQNIFETKKLRIELSEQTTTYGNPIPLIIKDADNNVEYSVNVNFALDYIQDSKHINTTTGYAYICDFERTDKDTLIFSLKDYQGEPGADPFKLSAQLDKVESGAIAVCEFRKVQP